MWVAPTGVEFLTRREKEHKNFKVILKMWRFTSVAFLVSRRKEGWHAGGKAGKLAGWKEGR